MLFGAPLSLVLIGLLALSLCNYLLRFVRWGRYLRLLESPVPWRINLGGVAPGGVPVANLERAHDATSH